MSLNRSERPHWLGLFDQINGFLNQNYVIGDKKMGSKFLSWLEHVGRSILHIAENPEVTRIITLFAPQFGAAFNLTVNAVALAEQKFAALGQQSGSGAEKLADVLQIAQPTIAQALKDLGKPNDVDSVKAYINAVVTVLNTVPAPQLAA